MFDKDQPYGTYWDYMEYMRPLSQQNPQQFLVVFYEDLKKVSVNIWHSVFIIYEIGLESYKKKCDE